jgi:hypothetical protein
MDKISPIKERILHFIEYKGLTKKEFCDKTGISYANLKGKSLYSEIGGTQIGEILSSYDEISPGWLIAGSGNMIKSNNDEMLALNEPNETYKKADCPICYEKDKRIQQLERQLSRNEIEIDRLWNIIECPPGNVKTKQRSA